MKDASVSTPPVRPSLQTTLGVAETIRDNRQLTQRSIWVKLYQAERKHFTDVAKTVPPSQMASPRSVAVAIARVSGGGSEASGHPLQLTAAAGA